VVLDVKFMEWAATQGLDTAKLKAVKMPIFGKWYFPELPVGVPLVNLRNGEERTFSEPMLAGETLWVIKDDLERSGLLANAANASSSPAVPLMPFWQRPAPAHVVAAWTRADDEAAASLRGTLLLMVLYILMVAGTWAGVYTVLLLRD
jgi:hypothetical protein